MPSYQESGYHLWITNKNNQNYFKNSPVLTKKFAFDALRWLPSSCGSLYSSKKNPLAFLLLKPKILPLFIWQPLFIWLREDLQNSPSYSQHVAILFLWEVGIFLWQPLHHWIFYFLFWMHVDMGSDVCVTYLAISSRMQPMSCWRMVRPMCFS